MSSTTAEPWRSAETARLTRLRQRRQGAEVQYPLGTKFQTGPNVYLLHKEGKVLCENVDTGNGFNVGKNIYGLF